MRHPKDPRPADYHKLVEKFRKVKPVLLEVPENAREESVSRISTTSGLAPYQGEWGKPQLLHLLRRTTFGVRKSDLESFETLSFGQAVDRILAPDSTPNPPINNYSGRNDIPDDPDVASGETWVQAPFSNEFEGYKVNSFKGWWIKNMLEQIPSLHQKMVLFWHNLMVTQSWDVFLAKASYQYYAMLHHNAFGNFRVLIEELTKDPAMLLFLNGTYNHKDAPDENYARELQELFTVGKGPGSQYTEADVVSAARILTGWVINWDDLEAHRPIRTQFNNDWHDTEEKTFSEFYQNQVIQGVSGSGIETDQLLDMILETDECAKYLCRRIYNFFVNPIIDENVEELVIGPLAEVLRSNDYEILPVMDLLLRSEHFYDVSNIGVMIKNPVDYLVGVLRVMEFTYPDRTIQTDFQYFNGINWRMASMGMEIADPPSVAGWKAYYQEPQFDKSWITTDTILKRAETVDSAVWWGFWIDEGIHPPFDLLSFVDQMDSPEDPIRLMEELTELLLGISVPGEVISHLRNILIPPELSNDYWTEAWGNYKSDPNEENTDQLLNRLRPVFQSLFQLGEFQLM